MPDFKNETVQLREQRSAGRKTERRPLDYMPAASFRADLRPADGAHGEIESLCLGEATRGKGLGRRLVEDHVAWMRARGCERIRVSVSHGHDSALGFYRKLGFRDRLSVLELKN